LLHETYVSLHLDLDGALSRAKAVKAADTARIK